MHENCVIWKAWNFVLFFSSEQSCLPVSESLWMISNHFTCREYGYILLVLLYQLSYQRSLPVANTFWTLLLSCNHHSSTRPHFICSWCFQRNPKRQDTFLLKIHKLLDLLFIFTFEAFCCNYQGILVAQIVKNLPATQDTHV